MIQDYRNQGIPSLKKLQGNEGLSINSFDELKKTASQQQVDTYSKKFFNEPCVTDFFCRNKDKR